MVSLGTRERRRLLAARQLLGATGRSDRALDSVSAALGLLHSTDPSTPHLSLHARCDASVDDVDAAFYDDRSLIRLTTIRRTVFAMSPALVPLAHGSFNAALVGRLRKQLVGWLDASADVDEPGAAFLQRTEAQVLELLHAEGPRTGLQLSKDIAELRVQVEPAPNAANAKPIRITSKVVEILGADGAIARARPTGNDFTSGAWTWSKYRDWGGDDIEVVDEGDALAGLLAHHLASFGPATVTDMTWWTGLTKTKVRRALADLGAVEVAVEDASEPGYVNTDDDLAELAAAPKGPIVALLPGLDSTTMGWKQRSWYVDDRVEAGIFDRNGNAGPTVWLDGEVVGAWTQRRDGEIAVEVPAAIGRDASDLIDIERQRLADWLGDVRVKWRYPTLATKRLLA